MIPSTALDDYPIWSPDSRYVAGDVMGTWQKVDLTSITLVPGTWHGNQKVGVVERKESVAPLEPELIDRWKPSSEPNPDVAATHDVRIEFKREELSTSLVVTRRGKKPVIAWTSDLETCGVPVVAPNERLVAFLCEGNGLLVMALR